MLHFFPCLLFLLLGMLLGCKGVIGGEVRIMDENDFSLLIKNVNEKGMNYSGTTVYLGSDLSLPNINVPIGSSFSTGNYFSGTFDGQGYVISDLNMHSASLMYVGIFGVSVKLTVKNVVISHSCSFRNSFAGTYSVYAGGIIGYSNGPCTIENCVNMANITFTGDVDQNFACLGGIVGNIYFTYSLPESHIKNCVNYGKITYSGFGSSISYVGGIVGSLYSKQTHIPKYVHKCIYNCLNYGTVEHNTQSNNMFLGGIAGYTSYTRMENCLNAGKLSLLTNTSLANNIGNIIGYIYFYANISYCFYTDELSRYNKYGGNYSILNESNTPNIATSEHEAVSKLNSQITPTKGWNKWIFNVNNSSLSFKFNGFKIHSLSSRVIVLPSPASSWRNFVGWFTDNSFTTPFSSLIISENTTLYGRWDKYFALLIGNGGNVSNTSIIVDYNKTYGELPTPTREGHTFNGWFTESDGGTQITSTNISTSDCTLYAHWVVNKYKLRFNYGNGTVTKNTLNYNSSIDYPEHVTRNGYIFVGWDNDIEFMPPYDLTITAQWERLRTFWKYLVAFILGIIGVVFIILIVLIFVLSALLRKKSDNYRNVTVRNSSINEYTETRPLIGRDSTHNSYSRAAEMTKDNIFSKVSPSVRSVKSVMSNLYPENYKRPTMKNALLTAGLSEKLAMTVCNDCESSAHKAMEECIIPEGLTENDVAAIAMYTHDFGPEEFEYNPYRIINRSLVERDYIGLKKVSELLYLVMTALRKLPRVTGITLYRGVRRKISLNEGYYKGGVITWVALSSTSPDMDATKRFLAKGTETGKSEGTLFIIEGGWGYNIQPYSLFPNEEEILLEPERQFRVKSIIQGDGLTFINLQMLDTPLSLPEVFGKESR